jgi:hypothetical protein
MIENVINGWSEVPNLPPHWSGRSNNITIRRDNRFILASKLSNIFVTNYRSFIPKFHNFIELVKTQELTLGLHSEIWESKEKKSHQNKMEKALELEGVHYVSNPRPDRRGGEAALTLVGGDFTLTKLDGTAKGGVIFAMAQQLQLPIRFIGVGEQADDLRPFEADVFIDALFSEADLSEASAL